MADNNRPRVTVGVRILNMLGFIVLGFIAFVGFVLTSQISSACFFVAFSVIFSAAVIYFELTR